MAGLIVVNADFEAHWPLVADHFHTLWSGQAETELIRLSKGDMCRLGEVVPAPGRVTRLVCLGLPVTMACLQPFSSLQEAVFQTSYASTELDQDCLSLLKARGITRYTQHSEGFWGESVSEMALGLTICALRRIPQLYHEMLTSTEPWQRYSASRNQGPGTLGSQFSDDVRFTSGTVAGKRVRIVGAGNIGSRYAEFMTMLGADVAAWDPFAPDPNFHRTGARHIWHLDQLVKDADIFAPMLPLTPATRDLITADLIDALPQGCLVVVVTRAKICDTDALRRRVLADELALAADVFDIEPLPLDDPLLGRHNVVHTPHIAGRTQHANQQWAEQLAAKFRPVSSL